MKVMISYPPLDSSKGVPLLGQNRQFQWFNEPTYIYPMVPAYAATLLSKNGYEVIWDDAIAEGKNYAAWFEDVLAQKPDMIAIETKTPVVKQHWKIINELKKLADWKPNIVLMGDHVTALPQESMENCEADFVITGGDYDFLLLSVSNYIKAQDISRLEKGIWYRLDKQVLNTGKFDLNHDLSELPFIDRELTKWNLYREKNGNFKYLPGTYTMVGRDCWYHKCTFCSWTTIFPKYRVRSPESLLDEIGILIEKYHVKEIMDDTGCFPAGEWIKKFCRGMIERGYNEKICLDCNMRFGILTKEDYQLMKQAGFRLVLFGLESGNQDTLNRVNKGLTREQIIESCKMACKAGLSPHITIMFGYPWENSKEVTNTIKLGTYLMKKGYAQTLQATLVIPYPGTPLFEECREKGWLNTLNWDDYNMREPVMKTPLSDIELKQAVQATYKVAFSPEFIVRKIASIRSYKELIFLVRAAKKVFGHLLDFKPNP